MVKSMLCCGSEVWSLNADLKKTVRGDGLFEKGGSIEAREENELGKW